MMRTLKLVGGLIAVLGLAAVATATAVAAETLWVWLPGATGSKFTLQSEKATLEIKNGGSITCKESTGEGELTGEQTLGLATIHFGSNCTMGGLPTNSLGDSSGHILVHVEIHNCLINPGNPGLLFKVLPLHIEVPSTKLLITVEGAVIVGPEPINKKSKKFELEIAQIAGLQAIEKCEGGSKDTLLTSLDGGSFVQSGLEVKNPVWASVSEQEIMA